MAAKSQHVQDSSVIERRLRPIYDWLELGNNKKALQESDKVIKKWPSATCARALRCLACLRLGRETEACTKLETLVTETPTEDATLQVITMCYRELHQLDKVCVLYERAVKADPSNEELHTHLFMSYVRIGALDKQHHAAMQLYKFKPKNPYYFWAVMSVLLQATRGSGCTDKTKRDVLVSLCGRMVERIGGMSGSVMGAGWGEQELRLYLRVLELQGKHKEALTLLGSAHCRATLMPGEAYLATLPLLALTQNWTLLNLSVKPLLWENPDRWDFYKHYLDSAFHLMDGQSKGNQPDNIIDDKQPTDNENIQIDGTAVEIDDTPIKCREFLKRIMEKGNAWVRGPYLARLELFKRLREHNMDPEGVLGSAQDLLVNYLIRFGSKPCSVSDLAMFLCLQPPNERAALAEAFRKTAPIKEGDDIPSLPEDVMQRHINALQLCRMCGVPPSLQELLQTLRPPRSPSPGVAQNAPTDPYCMLLAVHLLHTALNTQFSSGPLLEALDVLHDAIQRSPSNFRCKLLAIKLYHLMGCGWGAQLVYSSLEVKHVQLDSLGYVHPSLLGATGLTLLARDHYENALKFFAHSYKDSVDHLTLSYKFGSFNKLEELMDWRERLHSSLHHTLCYIEKYFIDLHCTNVPSPYTEPTWDALRDNMDVGVQVNLEPPTEDHQNTNQKDYERELWYCKVKSAIIKCIGSQGEGLRENITSLKETIEQACKHTIDINNRQPCMTRINSLVALGPAYVQTFTSLIDRDNGRNGEQDMEECCKCLTEQQTRVIGMLQQQSSSEDSLWPYRNTMDSLVAYIELLSVVCVVCGSCVEVSGGKNKSKRQPPQFLFNLLQTLSTQLGMWPAPTPSLAHQVEKLAISSGEFPRHGTWDLIAEHHTKAVSNLQLILKDKIKFIQTV